MAAKGYTKSFFTTQQLFVVGYTHKNMPDMNQGHQALPATLNPLQGSSLSSILSGLAHHILPECSRWKFHHGVSPLWAWSPPGTMGQNLILPSLMAWSSSDTKASRTLSQEGSHSNQFSHSSPLVTLSQAGQLSGVLQKHFLQSGIYVVL